MSFRLLAVPVAALLATPQLLAQVAPTPPPAAADPGAEVLEPKLPRIEDPMLKPPAAAPNVLRSWQQALRLLRTRSTSIRIAQAQIDETRGTSRQVLSRSLPTLTGTAGLTHHLLRGEGQVFTGSGIETGTIPDPATTWQAGLGLRVPVLAPSAWYDLGTANRATAGAKLTAKETERLALAAAADAIVNVVTGERLAEVSRVSLEFTLANLDLNQRRARLGAATAVDVLRAEQEVALARAQVVSADENLRRSRELLGLALGSPEAWSVTPEIRLDALAEQAKTNCRVERNIYARSDVRAQQVAVEVAERNSSSVDLTYLPRVDLTSDLTYLSHEIRSPNGEHVTWTIGGLLTWELYDGGLRYGLKQTNEARSRIAKEQLTEIQRTARVEVTQAFRAVEVAQANLDVSRSSRDLARQTARLSRVAFVNGTGTSFELVDTSRRLREAELDTALKEFEVIRAQIAALLAAANCNV